MPFTAGSDGEIIIGVSADADAAAAEIESDLEKAIARAMKDPAVLAAITGLVKSFSTAFAGSFKNFGKDFQGAMRAMTGQNKRAAKSMTDEWRKVRQAVQQSMTVPVRNSGIPVVERQVEALTANLNELATASKQTIRVLEELGKAERAALGGRSQEARTGALTAVQASRERSSIRQKEQNEILAAARVQAATINENSRLTAAAMRRNLRIIELTWRSATQAVRGFARAAAAAIRGFGNAATAVFRGLQRTIAASTRGFANVFRGFGRGAISALQSVSRAMASALRRDEAALRSSLSRRESAMRASAGRQAAAAQRMQAAQSRGILGGLGGAGMLGGLAAGGGIAGLLTSGFQRAGQEESLQLQFATLLQDGEKATQVLGRISEYARTTRFDFVEVAGSVAQLTAAFGDVDRAEETVRNLADIVSLTGGGTQQFSAARLAFSQIAASGRLEGQELNQLLESIPGVPIVSILADKFFGGDEAAFQQARRDGELGGKISADGFFDALEEGVAQRFPEVEGFAERVGTTLTGLADNLKENFAIFGAQIIGLVEGPLKTAMGSINSFLRTAGGFISGDMFEGLGGTSVENPFRAMMGPGMGRLTIPFEELPPEMQDILQERNGWGPNQGFVLAASHASALWDELHPQDANSRLEGLRKLRDIIGRMAKSVGVVLGLAAAFKILQLSLIALTSPLGLIVIGTSAIAGAFSLFYENSEKFRSTWDGMYAAIAPTGEALGNLVGSIRDAFTGGEGDGGPSILQRLGEAFDFIPGAARRALEGIQAFANTLSTLISEKGFTDFVGSLEEAVSAGLGGLFGEGAGADAQRQRAADRGGSNVLNLLEETFLAPVVRFFRGPFADLVERIGGGFADFGGFLGDIFNAIFGDGAGGIGTRVLDVLQDTFLGPIVSFFRDGGFSTMLTNVQDFFAPALNTVGDVITSVWERVEPIVEPLITKIQEIVDAFKNLDAGDFDIGKILAGAGIGAGAGLLLGGPLGGLLGGIGGALSQTGLFGALVDTIENAWEMEIKPALEGVWEDIQNWATATFTAENLQTSGTFILDFLKDAGETAGSFLGSDAFMVATGVAAGLLAAGIAMAGALTLGLALGIADAILEWSNLIADGLEMAWEAVKPNFIPDPIANALGDVLSQPITGLAVGLLGIGVARSIILSVIGGITGLAPSMISGAGGLAGMLFGKTSGRVTSFNTLGASIGGALMAGIAVGIVGYQAGKSGDSGNMLLSILAGGVTGAALGFSIGGPLGAGIGTALGIGIASAAAAFGNAQQKAKDFADEVARINNLIIELPEGPFGGPSEEDLGAVLAGDLFDQLATAATQDAGQAGRDWATQFIDNVDFAAYGQQITDGTATATSVLAGALTNMTDEVTAATNLTAEEWQAMVDSFEIGGDVSVIPDGMADALEAAGFTLSDLTDASNLLGPAIEAAGAAVGRADIQRQVDKLNPSPIDTVTEAVEGLQDVLGRTDIGTADQLAEIQALFSGSQLTVDQKFEALADAADAAADAVDNAKSALADFFREQIAPTDVEDTLRGIRLDIPDINDQIQQQLAGEEGVTVSVQTTLDIKAQAVDDFRNQIVNAIAEGSASGAIDSSAEFATFTGGLMADISAAIESGDLDADLGAQFLAVVEEIDTAGMSEAGQAKFNEVLLAQIDQATISTATTNLQNTMLAAVNGIDQGVIADALNSTFSLGFSGSGTSDSAGVMSGSGSSPAVKVGEGIGMGFATGITNKEGVVRKAGQGAAKAAGSGLASGAKSVVGAARLITAVTALQFYALAGAMHSIGVNAGAALARGLRSQIGAAAAAAAAVANAAASAARRTLSIFSPSRVFVDIGKQVGLGFIEGIEESEGDMAAAIGNALTSAIDAAVNQAGAAVARAQVGQSLFDLLQPSALPGGTTDTAVRNLRLEQTQVIGNFGAELRDSASSLFGDLPAAAQINNAVREIISDRTSFSLAIGDLREQLADAKQQQADIAAYDAAAAKSANRRTAAEKKIIEEGRPDALTTQQLHLLKWGVNSLNPGVIQGQANISTFTEALETIRQYGQTAVDQGTALPTVIKNMQTYRDQLITQARSLGFNATQIQQLVDQYGLSNTALASLSSSIKSLDQSTLQGAANVQQFLEAAEGIRGFGSEMIAAGVAVPTVVAEVQRYRNSLINQAVALGFNRTQINALITEIGLSDTALGDFIAQLAAFDKEAKEATATAQKAAEEAAKRKAEEKRREAEEAAREGLLLGNETPFPRVGELHVHIPSGDPEAVALVTANRLAWESVSSW